MNQAREVAVRQRDHRRLAVLFVTCLQLAACGRTAPAVAEEQEPGPAKVEHLEGAQPARVTLIASAARRLDIQTATIRDVVVNGARRKVIPYAAVLYDTEGATWTYTNPEPLVFIRNRIEVEYIDGDLAILSAGPPSGTRVVTVGAQELYGSELEFEEE
jgi:hypothetical protein